MPFQGCGYEPAGLIVPAATEANWNDARQCLRFVQHRRWSIKFPYGWADACRGPFFWPN